MIVGSHKAASVLCSRNKAYCFLYRFSMHLWKLRALGAPAPGSSVGFACLACKTILSPSTIEIILVDPWCRSYQLVVVVCRFSAQLLPNRLSQETAV